jgi:hypothetical protein
MVYSRLRSGAPRLHVSAIAAAVERTRTASSRDGLNETDRDGFPFDARPLPTQAPVQLGKLW